MVNQHGYKLVLNNRLGIVVFRLYEIPFTNVVDMYYFCDELFWKKMREKETLTNESCLHGGSFLKE